VQASIIIPCFPFLAVVDSDDDCLVWRRAWFVMWDPLPGPRAVAYPEKGSHSPSGHLI
jgi:hypothetical protein